ncbi:MAG: heavy-metal-associated domain-containing protein [Bacteroidota bacterium]
MKTEIIKVKNMDCGGCKRNVENAISEIDGVSSVVADLATKSVTIKFDGDDIMPKIFRGVLEEWGFPEDK